MKQKDTVMVRTGGASKFDGQHGRVEEMLPAHTGAVNVGVVFDGDERPVFFAESSLVRLEPEQHHAGAE